MIKRFVLLVVIFALSLASAALAAEPDSGIIEGWLVNGTEGGGSVADQDISLKVYQSGNEIDPVPAKTDAEGRFVFDGLNTESSYGYHVMVTYQQADYQSEHIAFAEGETSKSVEVTVYDSTTSNEAIKLVIAHTVIFVAPGTELEYIEPGSLKVAEYFLFVNEGDRTYIGSREINAEGDRETLRFPLPDEATELQIGAGLMDCCIYSSEDGFIDTMPVLPGIREVSYSYMVAYSSGYYAFSQRVTLPTDAYELLVQGEGTKVESSQLQTSELLEIEGALFNHLSGEAFIPGDTLTITLSGLPKTGPETVLWVLLTLLVLGAVFAYLMRRKRVQPVSAEASLDQRRQQLLFELARLDDDFEDGGISEEVYRKQRAEKKAQMVELIQRSKGESSGR